MDFFVCPLTCCLSQELRNGSDAYGRSRLLKTATAYLDRFPRDEVREPSPNASTQRLRFFCVRLEMITPLTEPHTVNGVLACETVYDVYVPRR